MEWADALKVGRLALVGLLVRTPATRTLVSTTASTMAGTDLPDPFVDGFLDDGSRDALGA
jgi:hypothetical protein